MEHNYAGVFKGNFELIVGNSIRFVPSGLQVIEHPFLLLLLSADIFCVGCKAPNWNYQGISFTTNSETGIVYSYIRFRRGSEVEEVPLIQAV